MPVYTIQEFGSLSTFEADGVDQISRRLYNRTAWTRSECRRVALELSRGRVFSAPDYETIILPGRFDVMIDRPDERPSWRPS